MKKIISIAAVSAALLVSVNTWAADIGTVNMETVVTDSPQAKKIKAEMEKKFGPQRTQIMDMGKTLQADIQKLQKDRSVMSKKDLAALQKKIGEEQSALQTLQSKVQSELSKEQNAKMEEFMSAVKAATQKVAKKEGMALVLPENSVIYAEDGSDITQKVIDAM